MVSDPLKQHTLAHDFYQLLEYPHQAREMEVGSLTHVLRNVTRICDFENASAGLVLFYFRVGAYLRLDLADCKGLRRTDPSLDDI